MGDGLEVVKYNFKINNKTLLTLHSSLITHHTDRREATMGLIGKTSVRDNIRLSENPRYPIFKELYTKQKKAVWFPEELNIQQDVLDYKHLSPTEKDLFDSAVGYFASSELLVQNVLGNGFFPVLTDPYAKMSFSTQMFMENIHSDFFEIILNSFDMDRKKYTTSHLKINY